ncbi:MAG: hypothetical protein QOG19_3109 [Mycobacterium sp.]|nr:hypothetical protein [Mycobacterium sp.]
MTITDNNGITYTRHGIPEPWEDGDREHLDDALLAAHLPNGIGFETGDGLIYAVSLPRIVGRDVVHLSPDEATELGEALIRMADLIIYRADQAEAAEDGEPAVLIHAV